MRLSLSLLRPALVATALAALISCQEPRTPMDLAQAPIIPLPGSVTATGSSFLLTEKSQIFAQAGNAEVKTIAEWTATFLRTATGYPLTVAEGEAQGKGNLYFSLNSTPDTLGPEGYTLTVTEDAVTLTANEPAGLFRGVQTLRQLFPARIEEGSRQEGPWEIATGTITDQPVYGYRGSMLDVARHFFGVEDVKRYIDLMAAYKFNVLHLHLSDDQGWRIEIKSWPNLTTHGGSTQVGGAKGGFYTQEQYKDIVSYAQQHYITVIPEIDMPGHTNAALASYPELNCNGKAPELYTGTNVGFSTLCVDKEITYKFVDDVVRELAAITPGPYFHVGGDESHATKHDDYMVFVNKAKEIVAKHGKQMVGWDETAQANIGANDLVQLWASPKFGLMAVEKGAKIIMSPANRAYIDMQYDSTTRIGLHWAGYIELDTAYIWDPATRIPGISRENIVGIEAPLWTETVVTMDDIEYLAFPRLLGYAEIGWTAAGLRNWETYKLRLAAHGPRMKARGIDFYAGNRVPWVN